MDIKMKKYSEKFSRAEEKHRIFKGRDGSQRRLHWLHRAPGSIPSKRAGTCAVYDGGSTVLILGGMGERCGELKDVLKYNLSNGEVKRAGRFPQLTCNGAATSNGDGIFLYFGGGYLKNSYMATEIYAFTTENPNPVKVNDLPESTKVSAVTSDGAGNFFILEECSTGGRIHLYSYEDGYKGVLTQIPDVNFDEVAFGFLDGKIYGFGGIGDGSNYSSSGRIFKIDAKENAEVTIVDREIEAGCRDAATVVVGTNIYIVGGGNDDEVFRFTKFDTVTEELEDVPFRPYNVGMWLRPNAVYVPKSNRIYIFGGKISGAHNPNFFYVEL